MTSMFLGKDEPLDRVLGTKQHPSFSVAWGTTEKDEQKVTQI